VLSPLPGGYIIVGGGLLALVQTEDELANALAQEIEDVELGQVSSDILQEEILPGREKAGSDQPRTRLTQSGDGKLIRTLLSHGIL